MNRILRWVNRALAVLAVLALVAAYWFLYRPLPQTSGRIQAFVDQRIEVRRDARGVPHIRAATEEDALFAQGFVTAQDRLFQMDGLRRFS
ncbi:MAG TPA: penicillin acylase family protein, partial [Bryobacteraceae bacterium]|nr:penicillin acylase family protein [Bryobacteraceae bacterium]